MRRTSNEAINRGVTTHFKYGDIEISIPFELMAMIIGLTALSAMAIWGGK